MANPWKMMIRLMWMAASNFVNTSSGCLQHFQRLPSALPALSAVDAGHKRGHGLIRRTRLQLVVGAFCGAALGVRAREIVGGRFDLGLVFVLVAQLLCLNQCNPLIGMHVLVRHERQFVRLDLFGRDELHNVLIDHVDAHGAQAVGVNLHKVAVVPFFHDVFGVRFAEGVIVDAALQIESRILGRLWSHHLLKPVGQLGANLFAKRVRVGNLQSSDGIRIDCCHE